MNYKGFDKDLKCRGHQFEVGKEYKEDKVKACVTDFHACEYPLDTFAYYPPNDSRYCEVEQSGDIDKDNDNSKVASATIKIGAEVGIPGIITASVEFIKSKIDWENLKKTNTGYQSAATNTGNYSAATNTGYQSAATNTGDYSAATNTGYQSAATNTGDYSAATAKGKDSVAIVTGKNSKARGLKGCWLVLTERGDWTGETYPILGIKAVIVDGERIKEDIFYKLSNGEVVEDCT